MWLFEFAYDLLLTILLCILLLVLSLISFGEALVLSGTKIILRRFLGRFSFHRSPINVDKFLDCPIAHRCGTPENSLAGIRWCEQRGAVAVEMDLNLTKDDVPVLFHDDVSHMTFEEVKIMTKSTICTLHEALELCKELNLRVFLDVKTLLYVSKIRMADHKIPVAITHRNYALTFNLKGKRRVYKQKIFNFAVPYLDKFILWSIHSWFVELFGISLMLVHKDDISKKYVESWSRKKIKILAWTVNNKHEQIFCDEVLKIAYMTDQPES